MSGARPRTDYIAVLETQLWISVRDGGEVWTCSAMALLETCLCCSLLVASAIAGVYALVSYKHFVIYIRECVICFIANIFFLLLNSKENLHTTYTSIGNNPAKLLPGHCQWWVSRQSANKLKRTSLYSELRARVCQISGQWSMNFYQVSLQPPNQYTKQSKQ